jgi:hypothetical protein
VSGAVAADRPGPRSTPPGTAELLCALSYGTGLAAAERMEHETNTASWAQLGRALGAGAGDLEAVFYGALVKDPGYIRDRTLEGHESARTRGQGDRRRRRHRRRHARR